MEGNIFHKHLRQKMDEYVHFVYRLTRKFPKEELYGVVSQFRRATLSIMLNYIEGYARFQPKVQRNFFEIAYGSLRESGYLLEFGLRENYLSLGDYNLGQTMNDEIGAMLWKTLQGIKNNIDPES